MSMLNEYGIELEFGSVKPDVTLARILNIDLHVDSIYYSQNSQWNISEDFSATDQKHIGMEIRSPKFTVFPYLALSFICGQLSANDCLVTKTSGLHFHFSGPDYTKLTFLSESKINEISLRLYQLAGPNIHRSHFCNPKGPTASKRSALRQVCEDHWECRVFNSTLNVDKIQACFNMMIDVLREY